MWRLNRLVTNLTGVILGQATAAIHVHWQPWGACKGEGGGIIGGRRQVQLAWAEETVWEGLLVILICDLNQNLKFISQVLCQEVHAATVLSLLVVADRHDAVELKNTCVKVHLSACLHLSNINFLKDPLLLGMIKLNKHSGGCWAESGGGSSAGVERCSEGAILFFVLSLSKWISGNIQYLVLLCLPWANTRSHRHLMLTSHSDVKSLAVSYGPIIWPQSTYWGWYNNSGLYLMLDITS